MVLSRLSSTCRIADNEFIEDYVFDNGLTKTKVPMYEAKSIHGFNQIIGYAKYLNRDYGNVYSRGECKMHKTLLPSVFRDHMRLNKANDRVGAVINAVFTDAKLSNEIGLGGLKKPLANYVIEGVLQHYGVKTRYIDIVDNHWVALWMGLYESNTIQDKSVPYYRYQKRTIPVGEYTTLLANIYDKWHLKPKYPTEQCSPVEIDELIKKQFSERIHASELYQYVLLLAIPYTEKQIEKGIAVTKSFVTVDLRQALPSVFLRPHAQHGLVVKKRVGKPTNIADYDMATEVIAIIRVRIDRAASWIGDGFLLSQDNLFPPPAYDFGYDILLSRKEFFEKNNVSILQYY